MFLFLLFFNLTLNRLRQINLNSYYFRFLDVEPCLILVCFYVYLHLRLLSTVYSLQLMVSWESNPGIHFTIHS